MNLKNKKITLIIHLEIQRASGTSELILVVSLVLAYLGSHSALGIYFRKDKSIVVCKHLVVLCVVELLQLRLQCVRNNKIMVDQFFHDTT